MQTGTNVRGTTLIPEFLSGSLMLNAVSRFFLLSLNFKKTAPVGIFQKALGKNLQPVILLSLLSGLFLYCAPSSHFSRSILNPRGKVKF